MKNSKKYPLYNNSGEEWLGEIPEHWKLIKTKYLFKLVTEPAPIGNNEELLSVYTAIGVKPRKELEDRGNKASTTDNYWKVKKQDIIVNKLLAWMGAIGISEYDGVTSPAYDILRSKGEANPYFYNYLFRNPIANKEFKRHSRGIMDVRLRLYFSRFGDIKLPFPSVEEQEQIVKFLNYKLSKINLFFRKKKQMLKLLNNQKSAIINQAVTKGIDPNVKMKPSGIDWLGDIPEHWEIRKLGTMGSFSKGKGISRDKLSAKGLNAILYGDIYTKYNIKVEKVINHISEETSLESKEIKNGCLLFTGSGETEEDIGKCIVYLSNERTFAGGDIIIFNPKTNNSLFLSYSLNSDYSKYQKAKSCRGDIIVHTYSSKLREILLPIPTLLEQERIIKFIEKESEKIDLTISKIQKEIELVEDYKKVLVSEAVTGKIDVRDYKVPEIDNLDLPEEEELELSEELEEDLELEE